KTRSATRITVHLPTALNGTTITMAQLPRTQKRSITTASQAFEILMRDRRVLSHKSTAYTTRLTPIAPRPRLTRAERPRKFISHRLANTMTSPERRENTALPVKAFFSRSWCSEVVWFMFTLVPHRLDFCEIRCPRLRDERQWHPWRVETRTCRRAT